MGLTNEHVGPKILAKIKIYVLTRAELLITLCYEIPCSSAQPSRPCLKNCQNGTFWSVHGIWKFLGPNDFIWGAIKVPFFDFFQKMSQAPSSYVQVIIWKDKLDYLKNPSQDFKNFFCLWFLWISSNAGRQNLRGLIFLSFNLVK